MNQYFHKYTGIIIQNDDPETMGRVKVYVPEISMTVYDGWNKDRDTDKIFTNLGGNTNSSITPEILQRMKEGLPWARIQHPIFGMGAGTVFHNDKNFSEQGGDSDSSKQQVLTNKEPDASKPENNKVTPSPLAKVATPPNNSATAINTYSNPAASGNSPTSFIQNATKTEVPKPVEIVKPTTPQNPDNVSHVEITFTPNERNAQNLHRKFTTSASTSVVETIPASPAYSAPITYTPASTVSTVPATGGIQVAFIPNDRNAQNVNRRFTTSASIIYDGKAITINDDSRGKRGPTVIEKKDITGVNVVYNDPTLPVNAQSERMGDLSKLFAEYQTPPTGTTAPVVPPSTVQGASKFNKGGGGSEMFSDIGKTTLLPLAVSTLCQVGATNPNSKQTINHGRKIDNGTDPNKAYGSNQQTSAYGGPPMRSESTSNNAKGMMSIPAVGAHVSVYFESGNPLFPIVDGVFYSQEDFMGMHSLS